jgi:hypothetical protein
VLSTGTRTDAALRIELAAVADDIALWGDRYVPAPGEGLSLIDAHPYLGPGFELQGKTPAGVARLRGLFAFNYAALASLGLSAAALSGLKFSMPRLVAAVAGQLFEDDRDAILNGFFNYDLREFLGRP